MDGRANNLCGMIAFGQFFDLFGVEEEQVRDAARNIALDVFIPMLAQGRVRFCVARHLD